MRPFLCSLAAVLLAAKAFGGTPQEPDFTDTLLVDGLDQPTCIAWAPDGSNRLFVSLKALGVAVVENGQLRADLFGTFPELYSSSECGALGLAFDPSYSTNHYVYVFVTVSDHEQQIVRFTDQASVGTQRTVILGNLPTAGINHDGGALGVGPDGKIYFAIGDNGMKRGVDADLTSLAAKVGRCNRDGTVPSDNPFNDGTGPNNDYIWATGFRNPFTMTFAPNGKLWLNVVGSTPDGQTEPRNGAGYEQVFVIHGGDDGGYDDFEGNQPAGARYNVPFARPLIRPKIQYKTDYFGGGAQIRQITRAHRSGGILTVTTTQAHPYRVGQAVSLTDAGALSGVYTIQSTPTAHTFTAATSGGALTASSGKIDALPQGGSITGGCFYTSTAYPTAYRGNFFYGDYVGGYIMRAQLDETDKPVQITRFVEGAGSITDVDLGPDGALYYADISGGTIRRVAYSSQQGLIVSPTNVHIEEGGTSTFSVRLGAAPDAPITVQIHKTDALPAAEHEIDITAGATLSFTAENWNVPQAVTLSAAVDADAEPDTATFVVTAPDFESVSVQAKTSDDNLPGLLVSTANLNVQEGKATNITVALPGRPSGPVKVRVRPSSGQKGKITVAKGSLLRFTPKNWDRPQVVRIRGNQDTNSSDQQVTVAIQAAGYRPSVVSITVADDDPSTPAITSQPVTKAVVGLPYHFDVDATGQPAPSYSLTKAPEGTTIDPATGAITWTPLQMGTYPVEVRAENSVGATSVAFDLVVNEDSPPSAFISQPIAGATISGTKAEFYGGSLDDYATYKAEFYIDDQLAYTDSNREGHYHLNGAHNLFDTITLSNGQHTLKLVVYDDKNQTGQAVVTVTISN